MLAATSISSAQSKPSAQQQIQEHKRLAAEYLQEKKLDLAYLVDDAIPKILVSDVTRLRQMTSDLQQIAYGLTSAPRTRAAGNGRDGAQGDGGSSGSQEDVIDAEFKEAS